MRLEDYSGVGEDVDERSESVPTASPVTPASLNLNTPANTIADYTIPITTLTIANLDAIIQVAYH